MTRLPAARASKHDSSSSSLPTVAINTASRRARTLNTGKVSLISRPFCTSPGFQSCLRVDLPEYQLSLVLTHSYRLIASSPQG